MDELRFYILFKGILVISGQWKGDNEKVWQWNPFTIEKISAEGIDIVTTSLRSAGQPLMH